MQVSEIYTWECVLYTWRTWWIYLSSAPCSLGCVGHFFSSILDEQVSVPTYPSGIYFGSASAGPVLFHSFVLYSF